MLTYIHKLIDKNQGSISISDFMDATLYHKQYGYYMNKSPFGRDGDFITAPEISQLFGEIIAIWVMDIWKKLGKPSKFSLVELGPGNGTLIYDIIRVVRKYNDFFNSVSIHLVEISSLLQEIQAKKLKGLDIKWHENIDSLPKESTIILANEFFDSLPIDQFVYHKEEWYEIRIMKRDNGDLFKVISAIIEKKRRSYISEVLSAQSISKKLFNGAIVEICLAGIKMLKKLEKTIYSNKGAILIIDYGYLYPNYRSTLQSLRKHKYNNFLENIGNSDITALVNFKALRDSLKYLNCKTLTQREFLYLFGIRERMHTLIKNASDEQKNQIFTQYLRLTENMGTLFKVMIINHL
ncbi:MAG: SAM-dependent methyltransferase [Wolbachia endosymbiont of Meromenopon meropis]|nr:SAM-dependent methyltransferase [Wolbachia endosymbiont of Meromenopon meropis]